MIRLLATYLYQNYSRVKLKLLRETILSVCIHFKTPKVIKGDAIIFHSAGISLFGFDETEVPDSLRTYEIVISILYDKLS